MAEFMRHHTIHSYNTIVLRYGFRHQNSFPNSIIAAIDNSAMLWIDTNKSGVEIVLSVSRRKREVHLLIGSGMEYYESIELAEVNVIILISLCQSILEKIGKPVEWVLRSIMRHRFGKRVYRIITHWKHGADKFDTTLRYDMPVLIQRSQMRFNILPVVRSHIDFMLLFGDELRLVSHVIMPVAGGVRVIRTFEFELHTDSADIDRYRCIYSESSVRH